eukprot:6223960-Amphidinium_carterae.1
MHAGAVQVHQARDHGSSYGARAELVQGRNLKPNVQKQPFKYICALPDQSVSTETLQNCV